MFLYIYTIAHYEDLHAETKLSPKNILNCLSLSISFLSQLSCLHVTLITMCVTKSVEEDVFG